jgi:hypothetical protein
VTLLSSEAKFVALSEAAKEVKFVFQVLRSMGVKVDLPIIVRVDKLGAIFIGTNVTVSQRSKHIDTRYHFVREYVKTVLFALFLSGPRTTMQVFLPRTYWVICIVAMHPRLLERSKMALASVSGITT